MCRWIFLINEGVVHVVYKVMIQLCFGVIRLHKVIGGIRRFANMSQACIQMSGSS